MRMLVPRDRRPAGDLARIGTRFVVRHGTVERGEAGDARRSAAVRDARIDEAQMARHQRLLRRQHFLEPPPPPSDRYRS